MLSIFLGNRINTIFLKYFDTILFFINSVGSIWPNWTVPTCPKTEQNTRVKYIYNIYCIICIHPCGFSRWPASFIPELVKNLKAGTKREHQSHIKWVLIKLKQVQTNKVLTGADLCDGGNPKTEWKSRKTGLVFQQTDSTEKIQIRNNVTGRGS